MQQTITAHTESKNRARQSKNGLKIILTLTGIFLSVTAYAQTARQTSNQGAPMQNKKILIAYFTRAAVTELPPSVDAVSSSSVNPQNGALAANTEQAAKIIQDLTGGALFRIETENRYPWNYRAATDTAMAEQRQNARPRLSSTMPDMDSYDVIFLGYPIWWGTMPMGVFTFLESYNLSEKIIIPFCTHGGSGLASSISDIKKISPQATVTEGIAVRDSNVRGAQNDIADWLRKIGISQ